MTEMKQAQHLKPGDLVDLESCPYLKHDRMAEFVYGVVEGVEAETPDCIVVDYQIGTVAYPAQQLLEVEND